MCTWLSSAARQGMSEPWAAIHAVGQALGCWRCRRRAAAAYAAAFLTHTCLSPPPCHAGRIEISAQNHNFAVDPATLPSGVEVTHINLNDGTCAGMVYPSKKAMSIQVGRAGTWVGQRMGGLCMGGVCVERVGHTDRGQMQRGGGPSPGSGGCLSECTPAGDWGFHARALVFLQY